MTFYEFASGNPWLTFFLGCLCVSGLGAVASAFRPCNCKGAESEGKSDV